MSNKHPFKHNKKMPNKVPKMIARHKKPLLSQAAAKAHDARSMRKVGISLNG